MINEVQRYLQAGGTVDELNEKYAISAKRDKTCPHLVLFKYSQIDSPMGEKVVQHARGVILDESDNWKVVSWAFGKFFNYEEGYAAEIDWKSAKIQEKCDGSLISLYNYDNQWRVATSGTPDASGEVSNSFAQESWEVAPGTIRSYPVSFADYFWQTLKVCYPRLNGLLKAEEIDTYLTYIFELTGPLNRIVVQYPYANLTLLGARHRLTGQEYTPAEVNERFLHHSANVVQEFKLGSVEEIVASFEHLSPLSQEGYVVVDGNFNRIKMKSPAYIALHHAKDGFNVRTFLEVVRSGEVSELMQAALASFPQAVPLMEDVKARYDVLVEEIEANYQRLKEIPVQKDFALEAVKLRCSGALFAMRGKKVATVREFLKNFAIDNLLKLLGFKE